MNKYLHSILSCDFCILKSSCAKIWNRIKFTFKNNLICKRINRKSNKGERINVLFIVQFPEMWNSEKSLYDRLCDDSKINVDILCLPKYEELKIGNNLYCNTNDVYEYLSKNGYRTINACQQIMSCQDNARGVYENEIVWFDFHRLKPDYIFIQRPYEHQFPKQYCFSELSKRSLLCFIPYGYCLSNSHFPIAYNTPFLKYCSLLFADSHESFEYYQNNKYCKHYRAFDLGFTRFDLINRSNHNNLFPNKERTVLWTPRWVTKGRDDYSSFLMYYKPLIDYFTNHSELHLIIRPHPLMLNSLVQSGDMSEDEINELIERINKTRNISFDNERDYIESFNKSSVLISDFSSLLAEYFVSGKPIIYCGNTQGFNSVALEMSESFYFVKPGDDVLKVLEFVLSTDSNAYKRDETINKLIGGNSNVADNIHDVLLLPIRKRVAGF